MDEDDFFNLKKVSEKTIEILVLGREQFVTIDVITVDLFVRGRILCKI